MRIGSSCTRILVLSVALAGVACAGSHQVKAKQVRLPGEHEYVKYFEEKLAAVTSDNDRARMRRKLIGALISVADMKLPKGSAASRVRALAEVQSQYQELHAHPVSIEDSYQDYYEHAYFLANHGFGAPVPFSYNLRRPEPDYLEALKLFEKARESQDSKLRALAQGEIDKILAPVLALGSVHYSTENLVLAVAVRNLDVVSMKLECRESSPRALQEWSVDFAGTLTHEVQVHYYRISSLPECQELVATASSLNGVSQSLTLLPSDKRLWAGRTAGVRDFQRNQAIEAVSVVSAPQFSQVFKQHHSLSQTCGLCHIPHNAEE